MKSGLIAALAGVVPVAAFMGMRTMQSVKEQSMLVFSVPLETLRTAAEDRVKSLRAEAEEKRATADELDPTGIETIKPWGPPDTPAARRAAAAWADDLADAFECLVRNLDYAVTPSCVGDAVAYLTFSDLRSLKL